jgi:predicted  nucleic acid-binding Zn-ribbon protein
MFRCTRCGSRYSSMHAAAIENCPRCLIRDRVSVPLAFKAFQLPDRGARASLKRNDYAGSGADDEAR